VSAQLNAKSSFIFGHAVAGIKSPSPYNLSTEVRMGQGCHHALIENAVKFPSISPQGTWLFLHRRYCPLVAKALTQLASIAHARLILVSVPLPRENPKKIVPQIATIKLGLRTGRKPLRLREAVPLLIQKGGGL
jgi:hypothetical protein